MKTITEAAKDCEFHAIGNQSHFTSEQIFRYGVAFTQEWIPIGNELPENVEQLIGDGVCSKNVLVKRKWNDNGEIVIEINKRFRPSERIGFLWDIEFKGSVITHWRPIEFY